MTLEEARAGDRPALWCDGEDEFLLDPEHETVYWRPALARRGDLLGKTWREVPWDRRVPRDGWEHEAGCSCAVCRPRGRDDLPSSQAPVIG